MLKLYRAIDNICIINIDVNNIPNILYVNSELFVYFAWWRIIGVNCVSKNNVSGLFLISCLSSV